MYSGDTAGLSTREIDAHCKYFPAQRALDDASVLMMLSYKKSACPTRFTLPCTCILMHSSDMFKIGMDFANPQTKRFANHQSCCSAARSHFLSQLLPVLVAGFPRKQSSYEHKEGVLAAFVCGCACVPVLPPHP